MKKIGILLGILIGFGAQAHEDSTAHRAFQMSFFYPLGTNGIDAPLYVNNLSINVLGGLNGGVNGVEIGGLLNTNVGDVFGFQVAGIANVTKGSSDGIIASGIANVVKDSSRALMFSGVANVVGGGAYGIYSAGITNTINGSFTGIQTAGISNFTNGNSYGFQGAGISNTNAGNFVGLQTAGITNVNTGNLIGAQFSLINMARNVTGLQVGLINIANKYDRGVPLGLISFVKDGYHALELSAEESIYANLKFKLGVERLYNVFKVGFTQGNGDNLLTYGIGMGSMISLGEKARLSLDLSANHLVRPNTNAELELLNKADFAFRYKLGKHLDVFAGPSINLYVTENNSENAALTPAYTMWEETWWNGTGSTSIWVGGQAGISVNF